MQDLTVTIIQAYLHWEDKEANLEQFGKFLDQAPVTDLVVLPEMFNTGFITEPSRVAEKMDGPTIGWMRDKAGTRQMVVAGSLIIEEDGHYYNRLIWMRPDGSHDHYDKKHLFRMGDEHMRFNAGTSKIITTLKGWKVCPLVCYDLRFPGWSRNSYDGDGYDYDMLIYVANWPEARSHAWKTLLAARAIENQAYVIGVNRVGRDGRDVPHNGDSAVYDMVGEKMSTMQPGAIRMETIKLSHDDLAAYRNSFKVALDWDRPGS